VKANFEGIGRSTYST